MLVEDFIIYSPEAKNKFGHNHDYVEGLIEGFKNQDINPIVVSFEGPLNLSTNEIKEIKRINFKFERSNFIDQLKWGVRRIIWSNKLLNELIKVHQKIPKTPILLETFEYISLGLKIILSDKISSFICIFHDTNFNLKQNSFLAKFYKIVSIFFVKIIIKKSTVVYVHGQAMKNNFTKVLKLNQLLQKKVDVLPYGAPSPDPRYLINKKEARKLLNISQNKRYLLSFGTLRLDKNFDYIFRSLVKNPDWYLIIAGPAGDLTYSQLMKNIQKYGIKDRIVIFDRFIESHDHYMFFRAADIVINIYHGYICHDSGTAQRARTFVVPILVGGTEDLKLYVENDKIGWFVNTNSLDDINIALNEYEKLNGKNHKDMSDRIFATAENKSWTAVAKQIALTNLE